MSKIKYVKTKDNQIIVFGEYYTHDDFRKFEPISAGFIFFDVNPNDGELNCKYYGNSVSLGLKADEEVDAALAKKQILGYGYY